MVTNTQLLKFNYCLNKNTYFILFFFKKNESLEKTKKVGGAKTSPSNSQTHKIIEHICHKHNMSNVKGSQQKKESHCVKKYSICI